MGHPRSTVHHRLVAPAHEIGFGIYRGPLLEHHDAAGDEYERHGLESRRSGVSADKFTSDWVVSDDEKTPIAYRLPNPGMGRRRRGHTASIVSLIRADKRAGEQGWSPNAGVGFVFRLKAGGIALDG